MKIRWPLVALGIMFFTVGVCGRFLYDRLRLFRDESRKAGQSRDLRGHENTTLRQMAPYEFAVPLSPDPEALPVQEARHEAGEPLAVEPQTRPPLEPAPSSPPTRPRGKGDLSAYKPLPRKAQKGDYLPNGSRTLGQLGQDVNRRENDPDWKGDGLVGKVVEGISKAIDTVDDAALDTAGKALNPLASPDKATVRPDTDGVKLHISIPTDSIRLK